MALNLINRGSLANDGTGDNLRAGAEKVNANFTEIYTALGNGTVINGTIKIHDDSSTETVVSANGEVFKILGGTGITSTISGNNLTLDVDTGVVLTATGTTTLTNKSIDLTDNTLTGTLAEFNTAVTDATLVSTTGSETLTNKTVAIGSNTISGTALTITGDDSSASSLSIGDNILFTGGSGITTSISGNEITFATDGAVVTETSTDTLTNKTINGPDNTLTNIANGSLANSSITLGDDAISLGGTQTTVTNLSLDGATGTIDLTSQANKIRFNYNGTGNFPTAATYEGMFAYDYSGNEAYVADAGGWVKLINENASIADLSNVASIGSITAGQALIWNVGGYFEPGDVLSNDFANSNAQDLGYLSYRSSAVSPTKTLTVTVASSTTEHYYHGSGSSNKYVIDGDQGPFLSMAPGIYRFDTSDSSNSGHPLLFYRDAAKATAYTTGVTTNGTPGSAGAYTQITIDKDTPQVLYYQCSSHAYMGHALQTVGSEVSFGASNGFAIAMSIAL